MVNETDIFILLGIDKGGAVTNDILMLDTRNVSSLKFSDTYPISDAEAGTANTFTDNSVNGDSKKLSSGAIAGIVVGSIALVSL